MGLYAIECPQCKRAHLWFSGSLDQRCSKCRLAAPSAVSPRLVWEGPPANLHNLPRSAEDACRAEMRRQVRLRVKIERELDAARAEIYRQKVIIIKLEDQARADEAFMMWQGERLTKARNHLARVRYHCDLPEVGDSGPGLDP
jgi:hypothetical protein